MTLGTLIQEGGWAMAPIYVCSVMALAIFLRKWLDIRLARLSDLDWVEPTLALVRSGNYQQALEIAAQSPNPTARVTEATLRILQHRPDRVEAEAKRTGSLELQKLESHLPMLAFIAQAAPLFGLLGTVLGMVELFVGLQASGMQDIDVGRLSSGIWKALLTTAAGLTVAVPTLAVHAWLSGRTEYFRLQVGNIIQRILNEIPQ
ncbi:MAG: MotA/TolQ/ExbB proton channel family protein [Myxococcales bacterium]|nr:MotA/TolQ/ExbB proton channel family protein [Myxococcales bacterium]